MLKKLKGFLSKREGEIIGIASTEAVDRQGEMIKQDGWDLLNFKANPVIMASHNYADFPIGKATDIAIEEGKLMFKMVFSKATEEAKQAYELVKEGILNCFSVGFIPREFDPNNQDIITKAELLEISLVAVPANPQAIVLAKSMKNNKLAEEMIKEWLSNEKMAQEVKDIEDGKKPEEAEKEKPIEIEEKEFECECGKKYLFIDKNASGDGNIQKTGEESEKVEQEELNVKLLQKTTGCLQDLLHNIKKGGAKK